MTVKSLFLFCCVFFVSLFSGKASADVWKDEREWTAEDEVKFVQWVQSDKFHKRIFSDPKSPYGNLATDCADVVYAARIIYAFENKLLYKSYNPSKDDGNFWKKYISNNTNLFDKYPEGAERVKAFITYLGKYADTKFLSEEDSYPILLKDIKPGDFYITEQTLSSGTVIRHTYIVKKVYASGIFDLYYSTLPYMVRELKFHRGLPLFPFSKEPFGFKRFKAPYLLNEIEKDLPGFSLEQYDLLKKVGSEAVLSEISKQIRTEEEGLNGRLERLIDNLCRSLDDRIEVVNESIRFVNSVQNRCVTKAEFNNYSTPVKDQRIQSQIKVLVQFWKAVHKEKKLNEFSTLRVPQMNYLAGLKDGTLEDHRQMCSDYPNIPVNVKEFKDLYEAGKISSHPNDSFEVRWGKDGNPTSCQQYYQ